MIFGTIILIDINTKVCEHIYVSFAERNEGIRKLKSQQTVQVPVAKQMFINRKVISEIVDMAWISDDQAYFPLCNKFK